MGISIGGGRIEINGKVYTGKNITIEGSRVYIDGVLQDGDIPGATKETKLVIVGEVGPITVTGDIEIRGTVNGDVHCHDGSVNCDAVGGNVTASGSVNCDDVRGSVTAGGSVNADDIGGSVKAGGSVRYG